MSAALQVRGSDDFHLVIGVGSDQEIADLARAVQGQFSATGGAWVEVVREDGTAGAWWIPSTCKLFVDFDGALPESLRPAISASMAT